VGDLFLDRFVSGGVDRISPEAPVPVLRIEEERTMLGGAGNVCRNLAALGATVEFVGVRGSDGPGHEVEALLQREERVRAHLVEDGRRPTPVKTRFVAGSQQVLRADRERVAPIGARERQVVLDGTAERLERCGVVVLSDYAKGVLCQPLMRNLIAAARGAGRVVIVDPKGSCYERYRGASIVTPNLKELGEATRAPLSKAEEIVQASRCLIDEHEIGAVLVTRGADGMTLVESSGNAAHLPAHTREVFDVSGAGDTVVAALAAAVAVGAPLREAMSIANAAAGIVVGKVGTAVAHAADLIGLLREEGLGAERSKILPREAALDLIEVERSAVNPLEKPFSIVDGIREGPAHESE
jgi:D-beta-D-heptose 7-phosphate kinase/D-beta-D-heptose 1-phosphate adenosyltransferase